MEKITVPLSGYLMLVVELIMVAASVLLFVNDLFMKISCTSRWMQR
jgi:hypothetical protein